MISSRGCGLLGVGGTRLHSLHFRLMRSFVFPSSSPWLSSSSPRFAASPLLAHHHLPLSTSTCSYYLLSSSSFSSFIPSRGYNTPALLLASRRWYSRERRSDVRLVLRLRVRAHVRVYEERRHEDRGSRTSGASARARVACARSTWRAVDVRITSVAMPCSKRVERKEQRKRSNV